MKAPSETRRIKIAKWIDEYAGRWVIRMVLRFRPRQRPQPRAVEKILFIKFWGIGSIILAEPALRALRRKHPHARIDFLTLNQNRELFTLIPHVDELYGIDFGTSPSFIASVILLIVRLRRRRYDLIFDGEFFANFSALVAQFSGARCSIGFSRPQAIKSRLLDVAVPFHDGLHATANFLRLISGSPDFVRNDGSDTTKTLFPRIFIAKTKNAHAQFDHAPYIVMNVNASPLALERRWPPENFAALANWLLENYQADVVLIGSSNEHKYTQGVEQQITARHRVFNLAGELKLTELAEMIGGAALFISNDSGPLHLAAALQKPVVGFYGPETPQRFGPLCPDRLIFYLNLPCSPCMSVDNAKTVNCTNHLRCMRDLQLPSVITQMRRFIDRRQLLPFAQHTKPHSTEALKTVASRLQTEP